MNEADRAHLRAGTGRLGVALDAEAEARLVRYVELLLAWNEKLNLTAVTAPRAVIDKHLVDAMALVPFVVDQPEGARLLDVGTGAGLPSVVLAILCPRLHITAVESIHKKVTFVRAVSRELSLRISAEPVRLEQRPRGEPFAIAVSRATFEPSEWVERGASWVQPGGLLLAMLSAQQSAPTTPPGFVAERGAEHEIGGAIRRILSWRRAAPGLR